jgi:alcohol dehydrogenase
VRAAVLRSVGHARPFDVSRPLSIEDVQLTPPGPGQLQVRMASAGLCHSDLSVITGARAKPVPAVAGHEGAGVVTAVGSGVHDIGVGDHVVLVFVSACGSCTACLDARPALCERSWSARSAGRLSDGTSHLLQDGEPLHHWSGLSAFAEEAVVARASVVRIDPEVALLDAAVFGCAVVTGVGAVLNTAGVRPGDTVAVSGLGGVGVSAVMGAVLAGAREIIAIDPSEEKRDLASGLGATRTMEPTGDVVEQVTSVTGGGVDFCFEMSGAAPALPVAYRMVRRGGALVIASLPAPSVELALPVAAMVSDEKRVLGSYMGSAVPSRDIPRLVGLHQRGLLPVDRLRSRVLRLDDVNEGFERLAAGRAVRDVIDFSR